MKYLLLCDVDSTLYDADALFYKVAQEMGINEYPRKSYQWFRPHDVGISQQALTNIFRKAHSREVVQEIKPYKGAVEILSEFYKTHPEVEIAYVSSRNLRGRLPLQEWIHDNDFPPGAVSCVMQNPSKRDWIKFHRPAIVIDDRVQTMLFSRYEIGAHVLSLKHTHNVNLTNEADGIWICDDWFELGWRLNSVMSTIEVTHGQTTYTDPEVEWAQPQTV